MSEGESENEMVPLEVVSGGGTPEDIVSVADATYEQLRKKVENVHPHHDFSAWARAIQNASILQLDPKDPWIDDGTLIQVRRMCDEDIELDEYFHKDSDDEYGGFLDIIKLPLPLPTLTGEHPPAPQFLFIRPDEYALFKCFGQRKWCVLTGNEGSSKSWFHWKFILLCYRQDLFNLLSPLEGQEEEDELSFKGPNTEKQTSTEKAQAEQKDLNEDELASKKRKPADQTFMEKLLIEQKNQAELNHNKLFIPNMIVRTVEGERSLIFFVDRLSDVFYAEHKPKQLHCFTDENSTILWEPDSEMIPLYYDELQARMIATVPPFQYLFHRYQKEVEKFYMPSPSEMHLRLMGEIYRKFALDLKNFPTDAEIHERVGKFGPFIHMALFWSREQRERFEDLRQKELACIFASDASVTHAEANLSRVMETSKVNTGSVHSFTRYGADLDSDDCFLRYTHPRQHTSCAVVTSMYRDHVETLSIETVMQRCMDINQNYR